MGKGTVTMYGRTGGFFGIGDNSKQLERTFRKLAKQLNDPKTQRKIHAEVGRHVRDVMRNEIKDANEMIRVRRSGKKPMSPKSKKGPPIDIPIGTLKRSVWTWRIPKTNDYWAGPRVTWMQKKRLPVDRDGWFANIVEGDDQMFGNGTQNAGVFERSARIAAPGGERLMLKRYTEAIDKVARQERAK